MWYETDELIPELKGIYQGDSLREDIELVSYTLWSDNPQVLQQAFYPPEPETPLQGEITRFQCHELTLRVCPVPPSTHKSLSVNAHFLRSVVGKAVHPERRPPYTSKVKSHHNCWRLDFVWTLFSASSPVPSPSLLKIYQLRLSFRLTTPHHTQPPTLRHPLSPNHPLSPYFRKGFPKPCQD